MMHLVLSMLKEGIIFANHRYLFRVFIKSIILLSMQIQFVKVGIKMIFFYIF